MIFFSLSIVFLFILFFGVTKDKYASKLFSILVLEYLDKKSMIIYVLFLCYF